MNRSPTTQCLLCLRSCGPAKPAPKGCKDPIRHSLELWLGLQLPEAPPRVCSSCRGVLRMWERFVVRARANFASSFPGQPVPSSGASPDWRKADNGGVSGLLEEMDRLHEALTASLSDTGSLSQLDPESAQESTKTRHCGSAPSTAWQDGSGDQQSAKSSKNTLSTPAVQAAVAAKIKACWVLLDRKEVELYSHHAEKSSKAPHGCSDSDVATTSPASSETSSKMGPPALPPRTNSSMGPPELPRSVRRRSLIFSNPAPLPSFRSTRRHSFTPTSPPPHPLSRSGSLLTISPSLAPLHDVPSSSMCPPQGSPPGRGDISLACRHCFKPCANKLQLRRHEQNCDYNVGASPEHERSVRPSANPEPSVVLAINRNLSIGPGSQQSHHPEHQHETPGKSAQEPAAKVTSTSVVVGADLVLLRCAVQLERVVIPTAGTSMVVPSTDAVKSDGSSGSTVSATKSGAGAKIPETLPDITVNSSTNPKPKGRKLKRASLSMTQETPALIPEPAASVEQPKDSSRSPKPRTTITRLNQAPVVVLESLPQLSTPSKKQEDISSSLLKGNNAKQKRVPPSLPTIPEITPIDDPSSSFEEHVSVSESSPTTEQHTDAPRPKSKSTLDSLPLPTTEEHVDTYPRANSKRVRLKRTSATTQETPVVSIPEVSPTLEQQNISPEASMKSKNTRLEQGNTVQEMASLPEHTSFLSSKTSQRLKRASLILEPPIIIEPSIAMKDIEQPSVEILTLGLPALISDKAELGVDESPLLAVQVKGISTTTPCSITAVTEDPLLQTRSTRPAHTQSSVPVHAALENIDATLPTDATRSALNTLATPSCIPESRSALEQASVDLLNTSGLFGETPQFLCQACGDVFLLEASLQTHVKSLCQQQPVEPPLKVPKLVVFMCTCGMAFKSASQVEFHKKFRH